MPDIILAKPSALERVFDASITWRYIAPAGHTLEMCQVAEYWRNNAKECAQSRISGINPWNKIEIIAEDGSWEAVLRILSVKDGLVETRLLSQWPASPAKTERKPELPKGFRVEHVANNGWRTFDTYNEVIAQKLATEVQAIEAAIEHAKKARRT